MAVFVSAIVVAVDVGTVAAIATAVAETGIALNVVGHITGSKTLEKVGGVMSMAGGVVGLAAGAFSMAAGETTALDMGGGGVSTATDVATDSGDGTGLLPDAGTPSIPAGGGADPVPTPATPDLPGPSAPTGGDYDPFNTGANSPLDNTPNLSSGGSTLDPAASNVAGATGNASLANAGPGDINATGSTVSPAANSGAPAGLNPTGSSNLPNANYDPAGSAANNSMANAPNAPNASAAQQFQGGQVTSNASNTLNSNGGNSAFQLNNESTGTMAGQSANLSAPGTQIAGQNTPVNPGGDFNDATGTYTSPSGNTITVGQNAEQVTDAANAGKPGLLDGLTNWVKNNQALSGQLASGAMQAASNVYATRKNAATAANQLALQQQIQNNKSAQVAQQAPSGIISGARKKPAA